MIKNLLLILICSLAVTAQTEILTNADVINMVSAGLSSEIITKKIQIASGRYTTTASALIELKKADVPDAIISIMMEKQEDSLPYSQTTGASQTQPTAETRSASNTEIQKNAVLSAKTISFEKSSISPSRQALEKELLKRKEFKDLGLTILRYKDAADLYVEIGFVSGSVITHRYVYRIYDRRSGAVIAAGETTSWGSLAKNLAGHISKSLKAVL